MNAIPGEQANEPSQNRFFLDQICEIPKAVFERVKQEFEMIKPFVQDLADRVSVVACPIFKILISGLLLAAQSTLFTVGFLTGVINPSLIQNSTQKICDVWNRQSGLGRGLIIGGAILAWPIALATSAFFVGGTVGVFCSEAQQPVPEAAGTT